MPKTSSPLLILAAAVFAASQAAAQDDCSAAGFVAQGLNGPFTNVGSTTSAPAWPCGAGANDVWFLYFPPAAGSLTVDTCDPSTDYDTTLELFSGSCGSLVSLGCNDDTCGLQSSVTATVAACQPVFIRVGGFAGSTGNFRLSVNGPAGAPCPNVALATPQGSGCVSRKASFYQSFPDQLSFDLSNTSLTLINTGAGYVVTPGGTFNPIGSLAPATTLTLGDDDAVIPGTLGLEVCSNGWVALATGNDISFNVAVNTMLNNPATAFLSWIDLDPGIPGSGQVLYEELGTQAQITFNGVWDFFGSSVADANNIQFQINTATGDCVICWGTMSTNGFSPILAGYSPGGPSSDPGNTDLSAITLLLTDGFDVEPLSLAGVGRPIQGAAAAAYQLTTSNIPATAFLHLGILGFANPGLPLVGVGMPDCFLNASLDVVLGAPVAGSTLTWTALNLPALPPSFSGFQLNVQSVVLGTTLNPAFGLGALSSNGVQLTIGTL